MEKQNIKHTQTAQEICAVTEEIRDMLIKKNEAYGDSALSPQQVFSRADPLELIRIRIDDKLNRVKNAKEGADPFSEDVELDLLGYLILHRIARKRRLLALAKLRPEPDMERISVTPNPARSELEPLPQRD